MSVKLMNRVFDLPLPPSEKLVMLTMASHADDDGANCYPSVERLVRLSGLSRRTIQTTLRRLETSGLLALSTSRPGSPRSYVIRIPQGGAAVAQVGVRNGRAGVRSSRAGGAQLTVKRGAVAAPDSSLNVNETSMNQNLPRQDAAQGDVDLQLVPLSSTKTKTSTPPPKKAADDDGTDPRHASIREEICRRWLRANPGAPQAPWNGRDGAALKKLLAENRSWTAEDFTRCIDNRFRSEVNHADLPATWIPKLISYKSGPLNQFNRPLGEKNYADRQTPQDRLLSESERAKHLRIH